MKRVLRTTLLRIFGAIALIGIIAYGFYPSAVKVDVSTTRVGSLIVTIDEEGETRIRERFLVSAPVSGSLQRLRLHVGDSVKAGETLLATINANPPSLLDVRETAELEARVRVTTAAVERSNALLSTSREALEMAQHELDRARELMPTGSISRSEFDHLEHQHRMAASSVRVAEFAAQVSSFERDMAQAALRTQASSESQTPSPLELVSPIDGRVLRIMREDAGAVAAGTELIAIGDPADLEIQIDLLSQDAVRVREGAKIMIDHWGGTPPLEGRVRVVEPFAFLKISALGVEEKRVNVIGDFTSDRSTYQKLGDGYRIEARVVAEQTPANSLLVEVGALFREAADWYVYRVVNGRAAKTKVVIGAMNGTEAHVLEGLSESDTVIRYPTDRVYDGARVLTNT